MNYNQQLVSNLEAEEALLGGLLLDEAAINRIAHITEADHFVLSSHQLIYKTLLELHKESQPTDLMSTTTRLANKGNLETVGGTTKLSQLVNRTVSAVNIDRYALLLKLKYRRRKLIELGHMLVDLGSNRDIEDNELNPLVKDLVDKWIGSDSETNKITQPIEVNYQRFISDPTEAISQGSEAGEAKPIISESLSLKTVTNSFGDIESMVELLKQKARDSLDKNSGLGEKKEP